MTERNSVNQKPLVSTKHSPIRLVKDRNGKGKELLKEIHHSATLLTFTVIICCWQGSRTRTNDRQTHRHSQPEYPWPYLVRMTKRNRSSAVWAEIVVTYVASLFDVSGGGGGKGLWRLESSSRQNCPRGRLVCAGGRWLSVMPWGKLVASFRRCPPVLLARWNLSFSILHSVQECRWAVNV